jgi:hypothetical protein
MNRCWYCECEVREVDDDGLCGGCVEEIIPKSLQEKSEEDETFNDEEE